MNATVEIKDEQGFIVGKAILQGGKSIFIGDTAQIKSVLNDVLSIKTHPEKGWGEKRVMRMHD